MTRDQVLLTAVVVYVLSVCMTMFQTHRSIDDLYDKIDELKSIIMEMHGNDY